MTYILGVDAGATRTNARIVSSEGKILGGASAGPANFHTQSPNDFQRSITEAIQGAALGASLDDPKFSAACLGVSGLDTVSQIEDAREVISAVLSLENADKLLVVNDIKLVHPACSEKKYGISLISGTGSNFYGINEKGEEAQVGGLDYLLADEGSSYWIGRKVLRAAVRGVDGRGPRTLLSELVMRKFKIKNIRELADIVYRDSFGKPDVAQVGMLVDDGYEQKDEVASSILQNTVSEIALSVNTITERLSMKDDEFDVVAVGGLFNSPFPFADEIQKELSAKKAKLIICDRDPVEGAVNLALGLLKN